MDLIFESRQPKDWGFDEVWPSTKAIDQPWFKKWVDQYEFDLSPFAYAMNKEVDALAEDMRRSISRQFYVPVLKEKDDHLRY